MQASRWSEPQGGQSRSAGQNRRPILIGTNCIWLS